MKRYVCISQSYGLCLGCEYWGYDYNAYYVMIDGELFDKCYLEEV